MPGASLDHGGEKWCPGIGNAKEVDSDDPLPVLGTLLPKWPARTDHSGVGNHHVYTAELCFHARSKCRDGGTIGDVNDPGRDGSTSRQQLINKCVKRRRLHVCERHS